MTQGTDMNSTVPPIATPEDEPLLGERHPLAHTLGAYKDDPMLDAVMKGVYKNRHRLEAEEAARDQEDIAA